MKGTTWNQEGTWDHCLISVPVLEGAKPEQCEMYSLSLNLWRRDHWPREMTLPR